jgi:hypothetical protein
MAYNTILIRRRTSGSAGAPSALSGGELAFNEVNSTLYYGSNAGVISIAGSGAYVDRTTAQSVSGVKTFEDGITLPLAPSADTDAANKGYVDTEIDSLSSALQTTIDNLGSGTTTAVTNLSTEVYNTFVKLTDDRAVNLSGGLDVTGSVTVDTIDATSDASVGGNLTVTGNLSVLGTQTVINTQTINISGTSTQIDVVNNGTGTGITVNQTGNQDVAEFKDDGATALIIKDGGNVGVGTATPNEKLTVSGNLSASGTIYGASGLEIGDGVTTLFVENGKVGINTETPNEELTVVGSISATENVYAVNGDFTGTLDVDGAATLGSTLFVTSAATFASSVSAQGALTVEGAADLNSTLSVDGATTLSSTLDVTGASTFASSVSAQGALTVDGTSTLNGAVTINDTLHVTDAVTFASTLSTQGAAEFDSTLTVDGLVTINNSTTTTGSISGSSGNSYIVDFIIDGGTF